MIRILMLPAARAAGALVPLLFALGCVPARPQPDLASQVSRASLVDQAIAFDTSGGALDGAVEPVTLTITEASQLALRYDSDIQLAMARVRLAEADADQSRLLPNPVLNVTFRFPQNTGTPIDVGLAEDLVAVLQRPGKVDAADSRLRAAAADALAAVLDTLAEVQERFVAVQAYDELMPVLEQRRQLLDRLRELAQNRLDLKEGTRADLAALQTQQAELELELAEKRLAQRQEKLALSRQLGRPSSDGKWAALRWTPDTTPPAPEPSWVRAALQARPEVHAANWELTALGVDARMSSLTVFDGTELGVEFEKESTWSEGPSLSVPIPLFDWGQARRAKAQLQIIEARHKLTRACRQIVSEVRSRYAEVTLTAQTLALVREKLLPSADQRRKLAEEAYRAGESDVTALILAEQDYQAARTREVELQQKYAAATIRLHRAVGGAAIAKSLPVLQNKPQTLPTSQPTSASQLP